MPGLSKPSRPQQQPNESHGRNPTSSASLNCAIQACVVPLRGCRQWSRSAGKSLHPRTQLRRFNPSHSSGGEGALRVDGAAFLFCSAPELCQVVLKATSTSSDSCAEEGRIQRHSALMPLYRSLAAIDLKACLAALLPALFASCHSSSGVSMSCMPLIVPFQVPHMTPDTWMHNARARAFHRCCTIGVCIQGAFAVVKFAKGNLIGGVYDGIQAGMGAYALSAGGDGVTFFPTYLTICGFNGVLNVFQVFQNYNGLPLQLIPKMAILPPAVSLLCTYWGWQFCREVRAIAVGLPGYGPQDTCFVRCMGGSWWPTALGFSGDADDEPGRVDTQGFTRYSGSGHVLGESDDKPEAREN